MIESRSTFDVKIVIILTSLIFFILGFSENLEHLLAFQFKRTFDLSPPNFALAKSCTGIAYLLMALPAGWIMKRFGGRWGIIIGLTTLAIGCFVLIPAVHSQSYRFFVIALFVMTSGKILIQTTIYPYVQNLGFSETATVRINLVNSFDGIGVIFVSILCSKIRSMEPVILPELIKMDTSLRKATVALEEDTIMEPYFLLGLVIGIIMLLFSVVTLPKIPFKLVKIDVNFNLFKVLKNNHLVWGVISQFFYVGTQVSIFTFFLLYAKEVADVSLDEANHYLYICGIAFIIGRFFGTFFMCYTKPSLLLSIYSSVNVLLCILAITAKGMVCLYSVITICFLMSIMFPTIFALAINKLDGDTEYGSSLVVMSIVGGTVLPWCFKMISDLSGDIRLGYAIPMLSFVLIALFGAYKYKPHTKVVN
ncbi:MFS transporter [Sphingobacterium bambusae]|uniref:MFS transporter n=1 Tax=Sphingobacterium bambusae TaxID=662858 RepID=A0ABW6BIU2_9SPHI|nr:MFS transporter [Sphingobacterium bambusae]WPL49474.1 MFS transporter [Sphingobacterium bambusae]